MTRWLLALMFAFGSVTFLSACEEKSDAEKAVDKAGEEGEKAGEKAGEEAEKLGEELDK